MTDNKTNKSKYVSQYGGGYVTAAQYIVEQLCIVIAADKEETLPQKFWSTSPTYSKLFRNQIVAANQLVAKYDVGVIVDTLRDPRCRKVKSLRANWLLKPILDEKQGVENRRKEASASLDSNYDVGKKPKKPMKKNNVRNRLNNL